jgi:hypothetical protein
MVHEYEIYALKYAGLFTGSGVFPMGLREWEKVETTNDYIW